MLVENGKGETSVRKATPSFLPLLSTSDLFNDFVLSAFRLLPFPSSSLIFSYRSLLFSLSFPGCRQNSSSALHRNYGSVSSPAIHGSGLPRRNSLVRSKSNEAFPLVSPEPIAKKEKVCILTDV